MSPFGGESSSETESAKVEASASPSPSPSETADDIRAEATPEESTSATDAATPVPLSPVEFRAAALGDLADMQKDVADAKARIDDGGLARLFGNVLELTFNIGQLKSITASDEIATEWSEGLAKLEKAVDDFSSSLSEDSVSKSISRLNEISKRISELERFVKAVK